jgi:hypothetical protein
LGFARTDSRPSEWIGCERITFVSTRGATLLSPDYAVLELTEDAERPSIPLGEGDVAFGEVVRMVSVTADRFYDDVHQVRSRRCVIDDNRQLSPWRGLVHAGGPPYFAFGLMTLLPQPVERDDG